jgi:hypothetical protein
MLSFFMGKVERASPPSRCMRIAPTPLWLQTPCMIHATVLMEFAACTSARIPVGTPGWGLSHDGNLAMSLLHDGNFEIL